MIRIRDISLPPQQDMAQLVYAAARQLRIDHTQIKQLDIKKRSVDARKKNDVRLIYTIGFLPFFQDTKPDCEILVHPVTDCIILFIQLLAY